MQKAANVWLFKYALLTAPAIRRWMQQAMQRFKTRPQFQAALAGSPIAKSAHFALHRVELDFHASEQSPCLFLIRDFWIGAMVPKRWAKRAVTRNAIKRQIYTVSAHFQNEFPQAAFLIRLRREFSRQIFSSASSVALKEAVRTEVLALMQTALTVSRIEKQVA